MFRFLDGLDEFLVALVRQVAVHHKKGMDNARYPEQQGQKNTQEALDGFAAHENRNGGQQDGQQVTHD